jgi:uncharacterized protein
MIKPRGKSMKNFGMGVLLLVAIVLAGCASSSKVTGADKDFFALVSYGTPDEVGAALSNDAKVDSHDQQGLSPLMLTAWHNSNPQVVSVLLQAGAKLDERTAKKGSTPLMFAACYSRNPEVISVLIHAGAKIDGQDKNGETPLMYAAWGNPNPEAISILLDAGAQIDRQDNEGWTALMYAAEHTENPAIVTTLLSAGASGKTKTNQGQTAFDCAEKNEKLKGTDAYKLLDESRF